MGWGAARKLRARGRQPAPHPRGRAHLRRARARAARAARAGRGHRRRGRRPAARCVPAPARTAGWRPSWPRSRSCSPRAPARRGRGRDRGAGVSAAADSVAEAFRRDGAVPIRGLLSAEQVETPAPRDRPQPRRARAARPGPRGRADLLRGLLQLASGSANTRRSIRDAGLGRARGRADGAAETARLFHDHVLVKEAGSAEPSPWHQDQPYYCVDGDQNVSFWIPVDPVGRESTLEFVAGSHASGHLVHAADLRLADGAGLRRGRARGGPRRRGRPLRATRSSAGSSSPGTRSPSTCSPCIRRAARRPCGARSRSGVLGDDARYAPAPAPDQPAVPGARRRARAPGDPFEHPLFPLLHPASAGVRDEAKPSRAAVRRERAARGARAARHRALLPRLAAGGARCGC